MIGTLDSARTQIVMESLLQKIVETGSALAIIDITGVPTVDTLTAQHLLKTVTAARLMGAECIISGIRPQIAQTIVHLGVDLGDVITKASLADALALAFEKTGRTVTRSQSSKVSRNAIMEHIPILRMGEYPDRDDPGRHARSPGDGSPGRPHRPDRRDEGPRRVDRHLARWTWSTRSSAG